MRLVIVCVSFIVSALAVPNDGGRIISRQGENVPCPSGLYAYPQCCATDVLGAVALDCHPRESYY